MMYKSKNISNFLVLIDTKINGGNVIDMKLKHSIVTIFSNKAPIIFKIHLVSLCGSKYLI